MPGTPTKSRILAALIGAALLAPGCATGSSRPRPAWDQPGTAMEASARRPERTMSASDLPGTPRTSTDREGASSGGSGSFWGGVAKAILWTILVAVVVILQGLAQ